VVEEDAPACWLARGTRSGSFDDELRVRVQRLPAVDDLQAPQRRRQAREQQAEHLDLNSGAEAQLLQRCEVRNGAALRQHSNC